MLTVDAREIRGVDLPRFGRDSLGYWASVLEGPDEEPVPLTDGLRVYLPTDDVQGRGCLVRRKYRTNPE